MKKVYIETYGCQMNEYDTELIRSILKATGQYEFTNKESEADVVFLNTCAIRENAHSKICTLEFWHASANLAQN